MVGDDLDSQNRKSYIYSTLSKDYLNCDRFNIRCSVQWKVAVQPYYGGVHSAVRAVARTAHREQRSSYRIQRDLDILPRSGSQVEGQVERRERVVANCIRNYDCYCGGVRSSLSSL